jgi:hypothetical protein
LLPLTSDLLDWNLLKIADDWGDFAQLKFWIIIFQYSMGIFKKEVESKQN